MLKIENLSKTFRTEEIETIALNNVSMEVKEGEFVAIMGPSGCGISSACWTTPPQANITCWTKRSAG